MTMGRGGWLAISLVALGSGCGVAPRSFQALSDPSAIVRARATSLGSGLPVDVVVPALIERLDDPDPVVRMAANEELKKGTRHDFGFVAWADPPERRQAVDRWRAWWSNRQAGLANARPNEYSAPRKTL